jgi:hypothetical protein
MESASNIQLCGAVCFGALFGWYTYYVNRYRRGEVQLGDLATLLGVLGGAAVLALFPAKSDLFGAYGIGLFLGFFGYFLLLVVMVAKSKDYDINWFLDGRRKDPPEGWSIPADVRRTQTPMGRREEAGAVPE